MLFTRTVHSAFLDDIANFRPTDKPEIFEKNSRFVGREFGDFLFRSRADDERFAAFFLRVIGDFLGDDGLGAGDFLGA